MYNKKIIASLLILSGCFLLIEHLWSFDGFDLLDIIGHEYYGIGAIIIAFLLCMKWKQWKEFKLWDVRNWPR